MTRFRKLLLMPFYAVQVFTGKKNYGANPILGSERLNRRGLHVFRVRLAPRLATYRRRKLTGLINEEDRKAFERDGFVMKPESMRSADSVMRSTPCVVPHRPEVAGSPANAKRRRGKQAG